MLIRELITTTQAMNYERQHKGLVEGKLHEIKGEVKEQAGKLTNSTDLGATA